MHRHRRAGGSPGSNREVVLIRLMDRWLSAAALFGFALSLLVQVASARGFDVESQYPYIPILHVGMFLVFIPFLFAVRKDPGGSSSLLAIVSRWPTWARILSIAIGAYALAGVVLFMIASGGGNAEVVNGKYLLRNHGLVLAHLTEAQYHQHRAAELGGFSALWLLFYGFPCIYFLLRREQLKKI